MSPMKMISALSIALLLSACAPKKETFASVARMQGDEFSTIAEQWDEGQELIEDGTEMVSDGKDMVSEGKDILREGEDNITEGREMVEQGQKLQDKAQAEYKKQK